MKTRFSSSTTLALLTGLLLAALAGARAGQINIPGPAGSGSFGSTVTMLPNGNFVVTDPGYSIPGGASGVGAVHLYDGITLAVISTLTGSTNGGVLGPVGVTVLSNGNYVVRSLSWNGSRGAVTWCSSTAGRTGAVSATNSLVGSTSNDQVGVGDVIALNNGNYVVRSHSWNGWRGAVTWGSGTSGVTGVVSAANSVIGSSAGDFVGSGEATPTGETALGVNALNNGNFVVCSPSWSQGVVAGVGAVTWCSGAAGRTGVVSAANSLIGSTASDRVGSSGVTALSGGNYVVSSPLWNQGAVADVGAVTWGSGTSGVTGVVSAVNSLVGSTASDKVGSSGVFALNGGNYVVNSTNWDQGAVANVGAVTWGNGASSVTGAVSAANSLVGSTASDKVGSSGVAGLNNGHYVVSSPGWNNGLVADVGAATWCNGMTGRTGAVSLANSLVGGTANDNVGSDGVTALSNNNYVVCSSIWNGYRGAVTWGSGATGVTGMVSAANSLIGSTALDYIGFARATALNNGNYVVPNPLWSNDGVRTQVGAVTWGSGTTGVTGVVSAANSLVGSQEQHYVGSGGVTALANGNYVVLNPVWGDNSVGFGVGAVTWGNGMTGVTGVVSAANSLVGSTSSDTVGRGGVTALHNGNYVVSSTNWDHGTVVDAGAVTWASGASGVTGVVSVANSLVGTNAFDRVGFGGLTALSDGQFVVRSTLWDNSGVTNAGAMALGDGTLGTTGAVSAVNSVLGTGTSGGNGMVFAYDLTNARLFVGYPGGNRVSLFGYSPEIAVEQPAGNPITDGGSRSFGYVGDGAHSDLTFTIKNTGLANLTGLGITIDGPDAAMFTVTANPVVPVGGPAGSSTFTVRFSATGLGPKTAALHLANNDLDESSFDINLTGNDPPIITAQPQSRTNLVGASVTFTVAATSVSPLAYQWRKDGVALANGGEVSGATSPVLSLVNLHLASAGSYDVIVSNLAGSVLSQPGTLAVVAQMVTQASETFKVMAANLTGNSQIYEAPHIRIFQGLKPDVVAIQEFNYASATLGTNTPAALQEMVTNTFGTNFTYFRETNAAFTIPNGIISRFPILSSGSWDDGDAGITDRSFAWTQLDLPGSDDLYVVSIHFNSNNAASDRMRRATMATNLVNQIHANFPANAWIIAAGDCNFFDPAEAAYQHLTNNFSDSPVPTDAEAAGDPDTSNGRTNRYDYVFTSFNLQTKIVPTVLPSRSFSNGLVFDSRVYSPLAEVAPIQFDDSTNCQHMPVVKTLNFQFTVTNVSPYLPSIVTHPQSRTNTAGSTASSTVLAQGLPPLSYQWRKGGTNLAGATATSLNLVNVQTPTAGDYDVVVSTTELSVTSRVATLTVLGKPAIAAQPQSQTVLVGNNASFTVQAYGTAPLGYQWRKDGVTIPGATETNLVVAAAQFSNYGGYDVIVTNFYGGTTSLVARLTLTQTINGQAAVAIRELPYDFHPGDLVQVRIQVAPPLGTTNWSVREAYPVTWDLVSSTNASFTNEFIGELVFGPFTDAVPRTLSYEILSNPGYTDSVTFTGYVAFNLNTNLVAGTTFFPSRNEWLFVGPQSLFGSQTASSVSGTAYGAGRWLASVQGWITTLESGGRLTYPRCLHNFGYSRLAYVGGLFLQFGNTAGALTPLMTVSDDGLSWKAAINEPGSADPFVNARQLYAAAYGNGTYVAVGDQWFAGEQPGGAILSSTNGYNWKRVKRVENPWRSVNAVAFTNGLFIAVANQGTLLRSTNGLDWTEIRPVAVVGDTSSVWTNRNLLGICYGQAGWIIPTSVAGTRLQSVDGVVWNERTGNSISVAPGTTYWQSFYADDKYWFSDTAAAYTTVDGASWSLPSPSSPQPVGLVSRALDGVSPQYLGSGASAADLVVSTNGANWTTAALGADHRLGWPRYVSVASVSNAWIVSGQGTRQAGGRPNPNDRPPADIWVPGSGAGVLRIRNEEGQWSFGAAGTYADFLLTTNGLLAANGVAASFLTGTNFTLNSSSLPVRSRSVAVQVYKGLSNASSPQPWAWVRGSFAHSTGGYDLFTETFDNTSGIMTWGHLTSTNGSNWSLRTNGLNHATNFPAIRGLAWGAGRFVAVSEGSAPGSSSPDPITSPNRIYTSTDGDAYTPVDLTGLVPALNGEGLTGVAFGNGRFIAIGNAGRILSSTNGLDWINVRTNNGPRWNRVRYLDGTWAAVGNAGWVAFSPDGQNWTSKTAGAESDLTDIAHQNGQYMVVGSHAMVLLSLPVTPPTILAGTLTKLPGAGLRFDVSGQAGKILDIQTSSNFVRWTTLFLRTNTTGTVTITDPEPSQERRFYRAVQQP